MDTLPSAWSEQIELFLQSGDNTALKPATIAYHRTLLHQFLSTIGTAAPELATQRDITAFLNSPSQSIRNNGGCNRSALIAQ